MNLPTKLKKDERVNTSFIIDNKGNDILLVYQNRPYDTKSMRDEVIKRYNSYTPLVIALTLVSTALVFTLIALI